MADEPVEPPGCLGLLGVLLVVPNPPLALGETIHGFLIDIGLPAVASQWRAPLHAVAGVVLDDRPAAPVAVEARVEVEDAGRVLAVDRPKPLELHHELRHHDGVVPVPEQRDLRVAVRVRRARRRRHRDVGAESEPARQLRDAAPLAELVGG